MAAEWLDLLLESFWCNFTHGIEVSIFKKRELLSLLFFVLIMRTFPLPFDTCCAMA